MPKKELHDLNLQFHRETEKAILVSDDDENQVWLPKSQIEFEFRGDGSVDVTMPIWLASEKKFAGF